KLDRGQDACATRREEQQTCPVLSFRRASAYHGRNPTSGETGPGLMYEGGPRVEACSHCHGLYRRFHLWRTDSSRKLRIGGPEAHRTSRFHEPAHAAGIVEGAAQGEGGVDSAYRRDRR